MEKPPGTAAFLFTDIEGSSALWEREPERMRDALAEHDRILRAAVERHHGRVVKTMGDGMHAVFTEPADAVAAIVALQQAIADPAATAGLELCVRCGLHVGAEQSRDNDFFGRAVNRAARIMGAAHGGQALLSQAVATLVRDRLPAGVSLRDLGEVRLRDLTSLERVYQLVHPQLRADFPALRTLAATPNNLPQQLTSFIGRERELREIRALLKTSRLLTLVGAGGIGKTRLSLQVAAEVMDDYPDGVWLVELAALTDPRLVPQAAASVLGVKEDAGGLRLGAIVRAVRDRRLLLIVDNCEHLRAACAELARALLHAGPQIRILASSREPLRVAGEASYPVPALAFPGVARMIAPTALIRYDSASLFIDRAVAAQPAFQVTEQNATALADICQRLDGIPLAIELAAARTRVLSVENIASRLDDRFRLLKSGDGTALPRQQTLRALIDWSYDLLTLPERALFRRLSVFAGGFTLEAAEAVGAGGVVGADDALDVLTQLVEKSLVVLDPESGRYRLLETVRQYAAERLDEAGEGEATRARHFTFCLAFFEGALPKLFGPEQGVWLAQLDCERENVLAAHAWCARTGDDPARVLRFVHLLKVYLLNRGHLALAHRFALEALARPGAEPRNAARSLACFDAGQTCCFMGRYAEATTLLEESLAIARDIGDRHRIAAALQPLGMAALGLGDRSTAQRHLEEALELARDEGTQRDIAAALNALAQFHRAGGALDPAEPLYEQVVALARDLGDRETLAIGLLNLAMVAIGRGAVGRARATLVEILAILAETASKPVGHSVLEVSAGFAAANGDYEGAARWYGVAEAQNALSAMHRDPADEAFLAPFIDRARAALGATAFAAAERAGRALAYDEALAEARAYLEAP